MVGWLGQEDVSGYIRNRPPSFVTHDILNYEEFADVVVGEGKLAELLRIEKKTTLHGIAMEMQDHAKKSRLAEEQLRLDGFEWNSWTDSSNQTLSRWLQTVAIRATCTMDGKVYEHVQNKWEAVEKSRKLTERIERVIKPRSIKPIVETLALGSPPSDVMKDASEEWAYQANGKLMRLAARRILFSPTSEKSRIDYDKFLQRGKPDKDKILQVSGSNPDEISESAAAQIISAWIASGAIMPKRLGEKYKDLSNFHKLVESCWLKRDSWRPENLSDLQCWQLNRMFLEIAYPTVFKERAMVSTSVVVAEDQNFRLLVLFGSSICLAVCVLLLDLNWVPAWFHFYRKRVRETFLVHADGAGRGKLTDLKPYEIGYPYPLFVAGMILPQAPAYSRNLKSGSTGNNPTKLDGSFASNWYSFLFSPLYCGWLPCRRSDSNSGELSGAAELPGASEQAKECSQLTTYRETKNYSSNLGVDDAVVLSGAAVTPFMSENISMRLLMHLFNFRLEQWMPNPEKVQPSNRRFSLVSMAREWLFSRVGDSKAATWRYAVVADGGFREFLGVEELIARRCRVVIVSDAGCNNGLYEFGVLADLIRKMRLDHRIDILDLDHDRPLDTRRLRRTCELDGKSPQHFVLGRIRYPEKLTKTEGGQTDCNEPNQEALLVYVQMSLTGDEDIDIEQFRRTNPNFPDEPISNQFYSREQVESFRQLGEHIGNLLCRDVSRFDCPTSTTLATIEGDKITPEQRMQEWRIRKLEDAFRSSYRNECRQESSVADDDARMGWILDVGHIDDSTRKKVHQFESTADHNHQLLIRDFVWNSLDKIESDLEKQFEQITPADIFGIAVECNRRHAGFRPEWPTSFFQVGGRDLLTKAAQKAEFLLSPKSGHDGIDYFKDWFYEPKEDMRVPGLISALSRLAVMLPRGVFRKNGCRTAAEVIACLMNYILRIRLMTFDAPMEWVSCERSQRMLSKAIRTGRANEVEAALIALLSKNSNIPPRANVNAAHE